MKRYIASARGTSSDMLNAFKEKLSELSGPDSINSGTCINTNEDILSRFYRVYQSDSDQGEEFDDFDEAAQFANQSKAYEIEQFDECEDGTWDITKIPERRWRSVTSDESIDYKYATNYSGDPEKEVEIYPDDSEEIYDDPNYMMGAEGQISLADMKEYWNAYNRDDPSLSEYQTFDEWLADTEEWLTPSSVYSATAIECGLFDFGADEAAKYGDLIASELDGRTVSKRRDLANQPGGLIYEADKLGIEDFFDLLKALEGMCRDGRAHEIDDSTYLVGKEMKELPDLTYDEIQDMPSLMSSQSVKCDDDESSSKVFQLMEYSSDPGSGIEGDQFYSYGKFFAADIDDAKSQLVNCRTSYPEFFKIADNNPYCDIYVDKYNSYFDDSSEVYQNLGTLISKTNFDAPEWADDIPFASTAVNCDTELDESQQQELLDIAEQYNSSQPLSGDWATETAHEQKAIADHFNITLDEAKDVMIKYLGFSSEAQGDSDNGFIQSCNTPVTGYDDIEEDSSWERIAVKDVADSDGFMTEYALYHNIADDSYACYFGDTDIYTPGNSYPDMEFDPGNYDEAMEWFDNYQGLDDYGSEMYD